MTTKKHTLPKADEELFRLMEGNYVSPNEENFFKNLQYKEEYEITGLNDLLVSKYKNEDEIYLVRMYYEEYLVGQGIGSDGAREEHVMTLSEALSLNLKDSSLLNRDLTLLEWLRECDYVCVNYKRNHDLER
ncbi:MAG: hypothetical protein SPE05_03400 [Bacteroidales bacterium]|nr:hypothetical protein [Bacteroidales bacterium]MDY4520405.1 hypothetical protein [Bacteroidales bacterium]